MKVTVERRQTTRRTPTNNNNIQLNHQPDLSQNPTFHKTTPRRKPKFSGAGIRLRRDSAAPSAKRSSRPETPLLKWKFDEANQDTTSSVVEDEKPVRRTCRKSRRKVKAPVSARKLVAGLWRLHLPECQGGGGHRLGLQSGGGHVLGDPNHCRHVDMMHNTPAKNLVHSPYSGPRHGLQYKRDPSYLFSNSAMEGVTKWDPVGRKHSDEVEHIFGQPKLPGKQKTMAPVIAALETELGQARARINELESERKSSKKKLEEFLKKLSEERAVWRIREHEKIRAVIDDMQVNLSREKKNRGRLEIVNSKLVNELADAKSLAKRYAQEYEKERKARELIEEVCNELAKEIGEDKAESEELKRESMKFQEEVEEERKMLQMAEVWREERVQMKLVDAKVMLEEKYSQINCLKAELESFLNSKNASNLEDMKKAEFLRQMASSVDIQDIRELTYEPPNPEDIFSVFEEGNFGGSNERESETCNEYTPASHASKVYTVSGEVKMLKRENSRRESNAYVGQSGELEDDASEWETVSHPGDQGSSYGSDRSLNRSFRASNVSRIEWERSGGEETPIVEISEVGLTQTRQLKKASSISRLWKSSNGDNYKIISVDGTNKRLSNGRLSNGVIMSPDHGSGKGGYSPHDMAGQWSSPEPGDPHLSRGMKGCMEWPRSAQKGSLRSRLMEAKMESQKVQLRQVLKQKC